MATYTVTTSNWNDPAFWSAISETGPGHTLDFSALPSNFDVDVWPDDSRIIIDDGTTTFTIGDSDYSGTENTSFGGSTQLEYFTNVVGTQGGDLIDGDENADTIQGQAGNDVLVGNGGNDELYGDGGNDTLTGNAGNDTLYGNGGNDSLVGGTGVNFLEGGSGADTLDGSGGGYDIATYSISGSGVSIDLTDGSAESGGDAQGDSLVGIEQIDGSEFADQITADDSGMELQGRGGNDTLTGGDGDDYLQGQDGADTLQGGLGNDLILGGDGADVLQGEQGNDTLSGGADSDTINVSDMAGTDQIDGGESASDADVLRFVGSTPVAVTFTDLETGSYAFSGGGEATGTFSNIERFEGASGQDTLDFSGLSGAITVTFTDDFDGTITDGTNSVTFSGIETLLLSDQADVIDASASWDGLFGDQQGVDIDAGDGSDSVLGGRGGDTLEGGLGNDTLDGDYGDDSLLGGAGLDTIIGGSGNDTIRGGDDNDSIDGGIEADTLIGDAGNDTILGGAGNDSITGGDGDDTFIFSVGDGADTITDFNVGNSGALGDGDTTNNDFINLASFYDNLSELREDFDDDGVLNQSNSTVNGGTIDYSDNAEMQSGDGLTFQGADQSSFTADNTGVVCFTSGTAIHTPRGEVLIDTLRVGDLVTTMDNGPQRIRWIGTTSFTAAQLHATPALRPVLIKRGVLGNQRDLLVSRQHGVLVDRDHLARAVHLAKARGGIRVRNGWKEVTYFHLLFDRHEIIFAENTPTESLYPGPSGIQMMQAGSRDALAQGLPWLLQEPSRNEVVQHYGRTARPFFAKKDLLVVHRAQVAAQAVP